MWYHSRRAFDRSADELALQFVSHFVCVARGWNPQEPTNPQGGMQHYNSIGYWRNTVYARYGKRWPPS